MPNLPHPLSFATSEEQRDAIEAIAKAEQRSVSAVIRIAIDEYLWRRKESAEETAKGLG